MRRALAVAERLGIEVVRMSADAPAPVFVVGPQVLYRPSGDPAEDDRRVRLGIATVKANGDAAQPPSQTFCRPLSAVGARR